MHAANPHVRAFSLAGFLAALFAASIIFSPGATHAAGTAADAMCTKGDYTCPYGSEDSGGMNCMKGKPCQDTTAGHVTKGECVAADNWGAESPAGKPSSGQRGTGSSGSSAAPPATGAP